MPSMNLCTPEMVKTYLGLTGSTYDAALDALIPAASERIERACRRAFGSATLTEYHDGGHDRVLLGRRPATAVNEVHDDPRGQFPDASVVPAAEYTLYPEMGLLMLRSGRFARGVRSVRVTYSGGYAEPPADLAQACVMLTAAWFHRGREAADGVAGRTVERMSQRFDAEPAPKAVWQIIERYREPVA